MSSSLPETSQTPQSAVTDGILGARTVDHITLVASDLEASRRFYVDVLGMREVERPDFGFPGLWFQLGSGSNSP